MFRYARVFPVTSSVAILAIFNNQHESLKDQQGFRLLEVWLLICWTCSKFLLAGHGLFVLNCHLFSQVTFSSSLLLTILPSACNSTGSKSHWFILILLCSRRAAGVTVVKVWETSRRYLRRVKAVYLHLFAITLFKRCVSSRSVKLPKAALLSFADSCSEGVLVGWLDRKLLLSKLTRSCNHLRENPSQQESYGSLGKQNAAWTLIFQRSERSVYFAPGGALRCEESEQVRLMIV